MYTKYSFKRNYVILFDISFIVPAAMKSVLWHFFPHLHPFILGWIRYRFLIPTRQCQHRQVICFRCNSLPSISVKSKHLLTIICTTLPSSYNRPSPSAAGNAGFPCGKFQTIFQTPIQLIFSLCP